MDFSVYGQREEERFAWFRKGLHAVLEENGHRYVPDPDDASLIINLADAARPRPFRRKAQAVFVVTVTEVDSPFGGPMEKGYPLLVRSLSNLLIGLVDEGDPMPTVHFVTPEQGHYVVSGDRDSVPYFQEIYDRIRPIATSRLVLDNVFETDLEESLWDGDEATAAISRAGKKLGKLNLLPTPFPMEKYLNERDQRYLRLLYGIGGLSYGNLSARRDDARFWMSASGVDKSNLQEIGRDILLVKGYDPGRNAMILSVPPSVEPRRVSVDAIEHWMVYREHPEVGAILHVHAWMNGAPSTEFNYPCGTYELGVAVADIVRQAPIPKETVVGLKNHGLTILGESMDEIFRRVEGKIYQPVPMS